MTPPPEKCVVLLSGGMDSAAALFWGVREGFSVEALALHFEGRPAREREAAKAVAAAAGVPLVEAALPFLRFLAEGSRPRRSDRYLDGYIPMRNLIFYAVAGYFAERDGATCIVGGHVRGDNVDFPDATSAFFEEMNSVLGFSLRVGPPVRIIRPFAEMTKHEVLELGLHWGVPFELTWSCWFDGESPCGECPSCKERDEVLRAGR